VYKSVIGNALQGGESLKTRVGAMLLNLVVGWENLDLRGTTLLMMAVI
jgi:hypothetical protein